MLEDKNNNQTRIENQKKQAERVGQKSLLELSDRDEKRIKDVSMKDAIEDGKVLPISDKDDDNALEDRKQLALEDKLPNLPSQLD